MRRYILPLGLSVLFFTPASAQTGAQTETQAVDAGRGASVETSVETGTVSAPPVIARVTDFLILRLDECVVTFVAPLGAI